MLTLDLNKATIELLHSEIVHVTFEEGGLLTSQLIRELNVMSRMKSRCTARAYVLTIPEIATLSDFYCQICKKAERIAAEIPVAVVCANVERRTDAKHCEQFHRPQDSFRIFHTFADALAWTELQLEKNQARRSPSDSAPGDPAVVKLNDPDSFYNYLY